MFKNNFTWAHLAVFLVIWAAFTVGSFFIADRGLDKGPDHTRQVVRTTLATIAGPMTARSAAIGKPAVWNSRCPCCPTAAPARGGRDSPVAEVARLVRCTSHAAGAVGHGAGVLVRRRHRFVRPRAVVKPIAFCCAIDSPIVDRHRGRTDFQKMQSQDLTPEPFKGGQQNH